MLLYLGTLGIQFFLPLFDLLNLLLDGRGGAAKLFLVFNELLQRRRPTLSRGR